MTLLKEYKQSNEKMSKRPEETLLQGGHTEGQSHMKRCSASVAIREMQIKTTVRYSLIPVRVVIINKSANNRCWRGCGEKGTLVHCCECRLVRPLWKTV